MSGDSSKGAWDAAGAGAIASFRETLPRVYGLKDALADPSHPNAYFREFEEGLRNSTSKLNAFRKIERQLGALDEAAWADLKARAAGHLVARTPEDGRGWQSLFDILSEARAFAYLRSGGFSSVHFIKRTALKTPDIGATEQGRPVFCEVKTINVSTQEAKRRRRMQLGGVVASETKASLDQGFLKKLSATLAHGVAQLDAADPKRAARRMVFVVLYFDDWVGDYQPQYVAQIDAHLLQNPVDGAELVFCIGSNLFERIFAMGSATILSE